MKRRSAFLIGLALLCATAHAADLTERIDHGDVLWLGRMTFGIDTQTANRFFEVGRRRFLDEQLGGRNETLPLAIQAQINQLSTSQTSVAQFVVDEIAEQKRIKALTDDNAKQDARKSRGDFGNKIIYAATREQILRGIYSPSQLKEQMTWFWLNHFSVFAQKGQVKFMLADYADRAIR